MTKEERKALFKNAKSSRIVIRNNPNKGSKKKLYPLGEIPVGTYFTVSNGYLETIKSGQTGVSSAIIQRKKYTDENYITCSYKNGLRVLRVA